MTMCARCLAVVADGPATTGEIASEVGAAPRTVAATMRHLMKRGIVTRAAFRKERSAKAGRRETSLWRKPSNT